MLLTLAVLIRNVLYVVILLVNHLQEPMRSKGSLPPSITPDSGSRIFLSSQKNFIDRFPMGRVIPKSPMPWESFGRMNDLELKAIDAYLETLKSVKTKERVK